MPLYCLDIDNTRSDYRIIVGDCESETHQALSFGLKTGIDGLLEKLDGVISQAETKSSQTWAIFSNDFPKNALFINKDDQEYCAKITKTYRNGEIVSRNLKAIDCDEFDASNWVFYGDSGALIFKNDKSGAEYCITSWLSDEIDYVNIEPRDGIVLTPIEWSQQFTYDGIDGKLKVLSNDDELSTKCLTLDNKLKFQLGDCENAVSFGRKIGEDKTYGEIQMRFMRFD